MKKIPKKKKNNTTPPTTTDSSSTPCFRVGELVSFKHNAVGEILNQIPLTMYGALGVGKKYGLCLGLTFKNTSFPDDYYLILVGELSYIVNKEYLVKVNHE